MTPITITVYGRPVPQGSKRHVGNGILVESSNTKPWREAVKTAALEQMAGRERFAGPVAMSAVFAFARPASHYQIRRNVRMLRADAPVVPCNRASGDIEKLLRCTNDALTDAGVWGDDSQVARLEEVMKVWADRPPLAIPGAVLMVRSLT